MVENRESITAKLCSFARAYHSNYERPKIFDDYLAYDIMGHKEYEEMGQLIEKDFNLELIESGIKGNIVIILPDRGDRYFSKKLFE